MRYITAAFMLLAGPALANPVLVNGSGSPAQAQVYGDGSASSAARSTARSKASATTGASTSSATTGPSTSSATTGPATGGAGGHGGTSNVTVNGNSGGDRPVSSAIAPAVMSFNPCSGSPASGSVQTGIFGFGIGTGGGFDNACRLHMLGKDAAAAAYLCRVNDDIRRAFKDVGEPCPQDRPTERTTLVVDTQVYAPDYCGTRNAGDRNQHRECDRTMSGRR